MSPASLGRFPTVLELAAVLCIVVASAQAQVTEFGQCDNYQTAETFTEEYIAGMLAEEGGHVVVLTSGRPFSCQELTLYSNNTFKYTTHDALNNLRNYTGPFKVNVSSYTSPAFIDLSLPAGVFGASLTAGLRLNVLVADPGYLLAASCVPVFGVARSEQVIALVPRSKFSVTTAQALNKTLIDRKVPAANQLHRVPQRCAPNLRERPSIFDIYNLLVKFGIISFPWSDDVQEIISPTFYSALSKPSFGVDDDVKILAELVARTNPSEMTDVIKSIIDSETSNYNNISPTSQSLLQSLQLQYPQSNVPGQQVNVIPYTAMHSPLGQLNNLQPISYPGPYFSNAQPIYAKPIGNGINVSPGFVQQFGSNNNVPTTAYVQPHRQANYPPFSSFVQQPTQFGSPSSPGFAQKPTQFGSSPYPGFVQQPTQFGNPPSPGFAHQQTQFGSPPSPAFAQQPTQFGSSPSSGIAQQPTQVVSDPSTGNAQQPSQFRRTPFAGFSQQ